ncbi:MAG: hypothetical protein SFY81_05390 [Verrucomicrobiota bacterium]|nr:hypothetical protein [Verrucomicrobiota bacterium]
MSKNRLKAVKKQRFLPLKMNQDFDVSGMDFPPKSLATVAAPL